MEEHGLENFEDPSDIIEDVVEISVENSVEVNLLPVNNNSKVSADLINNSEENNEVPTVTDFIEISVDKSVEQGEVPVNSEETVTASHVEETGEVSTATNTVNNNQIDPKSMKV